MPPAASKKFAPKKEDEPRVEGDGKFWLPNGDVYIGGYYKEGDVKHRHGRGRYVMHCLGNMEDQDIPEEIRKQAVPERLPQDIVLLDGQWEADAFVEGTIRFNCGAEYSGKIDAQGFYVSGGRYTWQDGSWFEGSFIRNIIHGYGKYFSAATEKITEGVFRNNHGPGLDERYKTP